MGAWGEHMQENDYAADVIDQFHRRVLRPGTDFVSERDRAFERLFSRGSRSSHQDVTRMEILGLADWLMHFKSPLGQWKRKVVEVVAVELNHAKEWRKPHLRRKALKRFCAALVKSR